MNKEEKNLLWDATVGSHMWKMNHPGSDTDIFRVYTIPTEQVLLGYTPKGKFRQTTLDEDISSYEIGHVVKQLQKGNINFLWGVTSPLVNPIDVETYKKLRSIVLNNLSKNYFHAVKGLAINNLKKYFGVACENDSLVDTGKYKMPFGGAKWQKKCKLLFRTLSFGTFLMNGKISYDILKEKHFTLSLVFNAFRTLLDEYENSNLPELPNSQPYDDFLIKFRLKMLENYKWQS